MKGTRDLLPLSADDLNACIKTKFYVEFEHLYKYIQSRIYNTVSVSRRQVVKSASEARSAISSIAHFLPLHLGTLAASPHPLMNLEIKHYDSCILSNYISTEAFTSKVNKNKTMFISRSDVSRSKIIQPLGTERCLYYSSGIM